MLTTSRGGQTGRTGRRLLPVLMMTAASWLSAGCMSGPQGIPVRRVPPDLLAEPRANKTGIDLSRLRLDPPEQYLLGPEDILGIHIDGVTGAENMPAPVQILEDPSLPPAVGTPFVIREDGTISLPTLEPLPVAGKTLSDAEEMIREAYIESKILLASKQRIIVSLLRRRTHQVLVIREDAAQPLRRGRAGDQTLGNSGESSVYAIELPAYENDVLHALSETGGLPGLDAQNEVRILRHGFTNAEERDAMIATLQAQISDPCCPIPPPIPPSPNEIVIPLRFGPGQIVRFTKEDITLHDGDVVVIRNRERDIFYTGGLLGGGQYPLPRDYDLDVLGAIALAEGPVGGGPGSGRGILGGGQNSFLLLPPTQVTVIRKTPCDNQIPITLDLSEAITSSRDRILIQPGDVVLLDYTPRQRLVNALASTISLNFLLGNGLR